RKLMSYKIPLLGDSAKILVIDDESEILDIISEFLKKEGYIVMTESSSARGIEKAESLRPDLILLDIIMPVMDGYEVCKALKNNESTKNIPVIFLTGKDVNEDRHKSFQVGGDMFIKKPFTGESLLGIVKIVLETLYM
ncbi:MAG: response regulator, partial [Nitrososphaeraceae archaeon]